MLRQVWPTRDGMVALEIKSTTPVPAKAYVEIGKAVQQLEHLAEVLGKSGVET